MWVFRLVLCAAFTFATAAVVADVTIDKLCERRAPVGVPEISAGGAGSTLVLLAGGVALFAAGSMKRGSGSPASSDPNTPPPDSAKV